MTKCPEAQKIPEDSFGDRTTPSPLRTTRVVPWQQGEDETLLKSSLQPEACYEEGWNSKLVRSEIVQEPEKMDKIYHPQRTAVKNDEKLRVSQAASASTTTL